MTRLPVIALALMLSAVPATAGAGAEADADMVQSCIDGGWPKDVRAICVGLVSDACQSAAGDNATVTMAACLGREATAWEAVMQRQSEQLKLRAQEVDAASGTAPGLDSAVQTLAAAQSAWTVYRDAECRYAYANWGKGEFRAVAHAACLLDLTARRVVDFHARLVTGG